MQKLAILKADKNTEKPAGLIKVKVIEEKTIG